jgi:hypothetical protein
MLILRWQSLKTITKRSLAVRTKTVVLCSSASEKLFRQTRKPAKHHPERLSEMDHTHLSRGFDSYAPPSIPERISSRFYLRANASSGEDLWDPPNTAVAFTRLEAAIDETKDFYDPPNTAKAFRRLEIAIDETKDFYDPPDTVEAFARLQTAIDEDKRWGSVSDDGGRGIQMLEPPTTAERFFKIESAIDEVLVRPVTATRSSRRPKKSKSKREVSARAPASHSSEGMHVLRRKRQIRFVPQDISHCSETASGVDMNTHNATELPASAHEVPYGSNVEPYRDVDIFHSDDAVQAFANQTYQSAREKFL